MIVFVRRFVAAVALVALGTAPAFAQTAPQTPPPVVPPAPIATPASAPVAAPAGFAAIDGSVVDASTGLGIPEVTVTVLGPGHETTTTDGGGKFHFVGLKPGILRLEIRKPGYQTSNTDEFAAVPDSSASLTLSLSRAETNKELRTIGRTSVRASQSLQKASVVYKAASASAIEAEGNYRVGDYLRTLPSVSGDGGTETAGAGDDLYLDIRGIGALETITLYDGHPIGYGHKRGVNLGYNFDLSPTFALRDVQLTYGSGGSDLVGVSAIGGIIDMHTIEPTQDLHASLTQGYGTYANLISSFNATGPLSKNLGFAVAGGVNSREGYYRHAHFIQPIDAQDPSAPVGSPDYQSGVYQTDSTYVNRGGLVKFKYAFGNPTKQGHVTVHDLFQTSWADRTGNSDIDYQDFPFELAKGNNLLANYVSAAGGTCPAGSFAAFALNGNPAYVPCQTPQQYARFNTGGAGAGPAWSEFVVQDYGLKIDSPVGKTNLTLDTYTNNYAQTYDRTFQLPYMKTPGDNPNWENPRVSSTGGTLASELPGKNNDVGIGYAYYNFAYLYPNGSPAGRVILNSPIVHETAALFHDTYHPENGKTTIFLNGALKNSTITHTTYFDPRLAVVYSATRQDVLRIAAGKTTSQPYAVFVSTPFSPAGTGSLQGTVICGIVNPIGSGGNPNLIPETGADTEFSYGHRFSSDSQVQFTAYNTNINNKIFQSTVPLSAFSAGYVAGVDLPAYAAVYKNNGCLGDPLAGLGVGVQTNVGHVIARGLDISGRVRFTKRLFFDYDYSTESVFVRSLPDEILKNNVLLIPNAQFPTVPIHKYQVAADYNFRGGLDLRLTRYYVGDNNAKNSPAYTYSNFQIGSPLGHNGSFNLAIDNVFSQRADIRGQYGLGLPAALNRFGNDFTPLTGQSSTELFALPYRTATLTYTYRLK